MKKIFTLFAALTVISLSAFSSSSPSGNGSGVVLSDSKIEVSVYPNPAHNNVFVDFKGTESIDEIAVFDAIGTNIESLQIEQVNGHLLKIETSNLQPGVYFVRVSVGSFVQTERIVIS